MTDTPIRVLSSAPTPIACELLAEALRRVKFQVVATLVSVADFARVAEVEHPDVALISAALQQGPLAGYRALRDLHVASAPVKKVMMLDQHDPEMIISAFRGGAKGVFFSADPFTHLCKCIRAVYKGEVWASSREMQLVLEALGTAIPLRPVSAVGNRLLTAREERIVAQVAQGLTNREIAQKLALSENTVKNYLFKVFDKLGVSSRVELVLYCSHNVAEDVDAA